MAQFLVSDESFMLSDLGLDIFSIEFKFSFFSLGDVSDDIFEQKVQTYRKELNALLLSIALLNLRNGEDNSGLEKMESYIFFGEETVCHLTTKRYHTLYRILTEG